MTANRFAPMTLNLPRRLLTITRVVGLILAMAAAYLAPPAVADTLPQLVKTVTVADPSVGATRSFFGQVSSKQTVDFGFQVGGRIVEFTAPEGTVIPKGTVIARLDPVPFEIEVERARLSLEQANRQLSRYKKLSGSTVSEAQVLDAETQARIAEVSLRNAEYALEQTTLIAPFDAIVAARNVANFSTVAAGTQVIRLHDLSELRVDIEVPEVLMQQIGENPDLSLVARFPGATEEYALAFREVNAETSEVGQTFRVTLALDGPVDRVLLPGASVTVLATLNMFAQGFAVPVSAIATATDGTTSVLKLVEADGILRLARQAVTLSVAPSGDILVQDGIVAGDEIVTGGVNVLDDGQTVRRFEAGY